ncbi:MAG: carboxy-S-adenosyl-L-methionine synthase CmoA [Methylococcales bacterium]|nr:carboxy-S-adenosyl-L-methionine synthase CmoA [Methylococcales bacterium]
MNKDNIYKTPLTSVDRFSFDETVTNVFTDMIQRSVPGYQYINEMTGLVAAQNIQNETNCYDLGCSLGASTLSVIQQSQLKTYHMIAVDNSQSMITKFHHQLKTSKPNQKVKLICDDVQNINISNASVVILNFTLQFIEKNHRLDIIKNIWNGLVPNGVLILSEKIKIEQPEQNKLLTDLHHVFKKVNGYSDLEISQKRTALENVLQPDTVDNHMQRLQQAGFKSSLQWFQCFNFVSILSKK